MIFHSKLKLRDYQEEALEAVWAEMFQEQFSLFVGSTGLGKTEILLGLIKKCIDSKPNVRIAFVVNKLNLLNQTDRRVKDAFGNISSIYSGDIKDDSKPVVVGSIQSLHKKKLRFDVILLDEAHNINQESGMYSRFIGNITSVNPRARVVACTATPFRGDGNIYGTDKWFPRICFQRGLLWSIDNGFLVRPSAKRVDKKFDTSKLKIKMGDYDMKSLNDLVKDNEKIFEQIKDALPQLEGRSCIIWACINIKHAEAVATILRHMGEKVSIVHSKQESDEYHWNLRFFEAKRHRHLVFVTIVSEGYDFPPIDSVVMMRPTRSPILYVQTIGRGLRPYGDKKDCLVLDYGGVIENCGPLHSPYIPEKGKKQSSKVVEIRMKFCKHCYEYCELKVKTCPSCEKPFDEELHKDDLKNLKNKSFSGDIMGYVKFPVSKIQIEKYVSKAGNKCAKVDYFSDGIQLETVREFFLLDKIWAKNEFALRMKTLGLYSVDVSEIPKVYKTKQCEIQIYKDGKYWKVKG